MIAAGLLFLAALAAPIEGEGVERRLFCVQESVEVGEPLQLVLELGVPATVSGTRLATGELTLDDSWVLFDTRLEPSVVDPARPERRVTRRIWEVASLDPGERVLVVHDLDPLDDEDDGVELLTVEIAGVLAEGEDEPRPLRGFSDTFGAAGTEAAGLSTRAKLAIGAGILLAALLVLVAFHLLRMRRATRSDRPVDPLARLEALRAEEAEVATRHYELSRLLRTATDARLNRDGRGLTDDEWLEAVAGDRTLDERFRHELSVALSKCHRVKYAGDRPSAWAVDETFQSARAALEVLSKVDAKETAKEGAA